MIRILVVWKRVVVRWSDRKVFELIRVLKKTSYLIRILMHVHAQ